MVCVLWVCCYDFNGVKLVIKFPLLLCCTICLVHLLVTICSLFWHTVKAGSFCNTGAEEKKQQEKNKKAENETSFGLNLWECSHAHVWALILILFFWVTLNMTFTWNWAGNSYLIRHIITFSRFLSAGVSYFFNIIATQICPHRFRSAAVDASSFVSGSLNSAAFSLCTLLLDIYSNFF